MNSTYIYSPLPVDSYRLCGMQGADEASVVLTFSDPLPCWNLFWLSQPGIDCVPAAGADWWRHYKPSDGLLAAVIRDVAEQPELEDALRRHPYAFNEWLHDQSPRRWRTYKVAGYMAWLQGVIARAEEAGDRMLKAKPFISIRDDKLEVGP